MTMISVGSFTPFGSAGFAPASPQSARGESVMVNELQTEMVAASQANSPRHDQRAQLSDSLVTARTATLELTARQGDLARATQSPHQETAQQAAQFAASMRELSPQQRVQHSEGAEPKRTDEQSARNRTRQRALDAYGSASQDASAATPGEFLNAAI